MRKIVGFNDLKTERQFWYYFLIGNFINSYDEETDMDVNDLVIENFTLDKNWIDRFTNYNVEIFDINDGYTEDPNTIELKLSPKDTVYIEFHPGDTVFYLNGNKLGNTGGHYDIHKISWSAFKEYTVKLSNEECMLLIPMLFVTGEEKVELYDFLLKTLAPITGRSDVIKNICGGIVKNCTPE
ncbi:MAG: immunity protein 19 [Firmicutes bacterium]|nr:immunity protein 19 [Bacillota bacterium]MBQ9605357.1 immunity protein 19 [Bacillota bacterium]